MDSIAIICYYVHTGRERFPALETWHSPFDIRRFPVARVELVDIDAAVELSLLALAVGMHTTVLVNIRNLRQILISVYYWKTSLSYGKTSDMRKEMYPIVKFTFTFDFFFCLRIPRTAEESTYLYSYPMIGPKYPIRTPRNLSTRNLMNLLWSPSSWGRSAANEDIKALSKTTRIRTNIYYRLNIEK